MMNIREIIESALFTTANFDNDDEIAEHIISAMQPYFEQIVEMRYAQRAYFRRKVEDNLSKAKRLEILVDLQLLEFDTKRNIPVQIDFPINY